MIGVPRRLQPKRRSPRPAGAEIPALTGHVETEGEQAGDGGAKRWRGRRRRRGGRGAPTHVADPVETEASAETYLEPAETAETDVATEIQAAGAAAESRAAQPWTPPARSQRPERGERTPAPFVLPGESLSKYGGEPAAEPPKAESQPTSPARPASTFKPVTLIETPIEWDGTGPLPGESLSRHRRSRPEPETSTGMHGEPQGVFSDAPHAAPTEEPFLEETVEYAPETSAESAAESAAGSAIETTELGPGEDYLEPEELNTEELVEEEQFEEPLPGAPAEELVPEVTVPEPIVNDPFASDPFFAGGGYAQEEHSGEPGSESNIAHNPVEPVIHGSAASSEAVEPEGDRRASHLVDPNPPSGFRLFGFGGKKRPEEPPPAAPARTEPQPSTVTSVSAFAPGPGTVEEEVIEEEEFEAPRHHYKGEEHDLDEYEEEEKLQTQIRSGELGEMLQEAHLDHRIQMNFDDKSAEVEGDDVFDIEDEEEEQAEAEGVPPAAGRRIPAASAANAGAADAAEAVDRRIGAIAAEAPRAAPRRPPTCPSFPIFSSPARKSWSRSPRNPSPRRAPASPATSPCPAGSWYSCPR